MSVKDLPDYTRQVVIRYEGGFIGLEELAARLGSIVPFDLRGNIVLMEDFESEETEWLTSGTGSGNTIARSSGHKFSGDWSVKFSAGGSTSAFLRLYRNLHFPGLTKYGLFARLNFTGYDFRSWLYMYFETGSKLLEVYVDYNIQTGVLRTRSPEGYYTVASNLFLGFGDDYIWFPLLITFDLVTGYHDKLYFADQEYDLSSLALESTDSDQPPRAYIEAGMVCTVGAVRSIYVDDIIIAKNVP